MLWGIYLVIFAPVKQLILMRIIAVFICLFLSLPVVFSQQDQPSSVELEKRRQAILESIKQTEDQLAAIKKDKNATLSQLQALQNKLRQRQKLINNINQEISQINNNIEKSAYEVTRLNSNLEALKIRYAQSVRYAYKSRSSYDMLAFIFSANDYNDALRRVRYLKKYRDYRKEQADQIRTTQGVIVKKIDVLNTQKTEKDHLLSAEEQQKTVLQTESNETKEVVKELKGKESQLAASIEKDKKSAKKLENTIRDIIRREIEIARKKAEEEERKRQEEERRKKEEEAKRAAAANTGGVTVNTGSGTHVIGGNNNPNSKPTTTVATKPEAKHEPMPNIKHAVETPSYALSLTPEVAALSNSFEANRGKLPWPVEKGFLAEPFGQHQHAVAEKVTIDNKGIEIQTAPNAGARSIFDGEVTAVFFVPGMGQSVIINHGQYFTVYSRISNVTLKKGDKVRTKQSLGSVVLNDDGVPMMHFELWKVAGSTSNPIDPATWIAR